MMTILCTGSLPDRVFPQITISFCSAWWESPALDCVVMVNNLKWVRRLRAFHGGLDCEKEGCRWQIRKDHPFLFTQAQGKYVQMEYDR